jgi:hypothetical protein
LMQVHMTNGATFNNISVTLVSFFVVVVNFHGLAATERSVDIDKWSKFY